MDFKGVRLKNKRKDFVSLGRGTYEVLYRVQHATYSTVVVIIYDNIVIDIGYKYTTSSWHLNGFPNDSDLLGSTVYCRGDPPLCYTRTIH